MQNSKIRQPLQKLREELNVAAVRSAIFFRNLLISIRWLPRHRKYWRGIDEVLDRMPLPNLKFISNVTGTPDIAWYLVSGKLSAEDIIRILRKNGVDLCTLRSILDFGCGCARVTRHMFSLNNSPIYGVDVDQKAVEWCQAHLTRGNFKLTSHTPALDYGDSTFNLVYALSIFTHLTTDMVIGWIAELMHVIAPGGYLVFTTLGETFIQSLSKTERLQFLHGSPVVKNPNYSSNNLCRAYHPHEFVSKELKKGFMLIDFCPGGAKGNPTQDLYMFRKN